MFFVEVCEVKEGEGDKKSGAIGKLVCVFGKLSCVDLVVIISRTVVLVLV